MIVATAAITMTSHADIVTESDPGGYDTFAIMTGGEGVPDDASRWFSILDGEAQYTAWANNPITYSTELASEPTDWRVGITAMNWHGPAPDFWYDSFKVGVTVDDQFVDYVYIEASDDEWITSWLDIGERSGDVSVELNWVNDKWEPNVYDANIAIGAVQFAGAAVPVPSSIIALAAGAMWGATRRRRKGNLHNS